MRKAKVPAAAVVQMVWDSLCRRMDPETHQVRPSWLTLMRETGVCRQRIADAIATLRKQGKIETFTVPIKAGSEKVKVFYKINALPHESNGSVDESH